MSNISQIRNNSHRMYKARSNWNNEKKNCVSIKNSVLEGAGRALLLFSCWFLADGSSLV